MFFLPTGDHRPDDLILSAGDIVAAAGCEYGAMRALDALLGRVEPAVAKDDGMLELVSALGQADRVSSCRAFRVPRVSLPGTIS